MYKKGQQAWLHQREQHGTTTTTTKTIPPCNIMTAPLQWHNATLIQHCCGLNAAMTRRKPLQCNPSSDITTIAATTTPLMQHCHQNITIIDHEPNTAATLLPIQCFYFKSIITCKNMSMPYRTFCA